MIETNNIPQHIAIIMDGNGRWANERGKERSFGHQAGVEAVRKITAECTRLGVKYLTLYTFSTENWGRPADEVAALMGLVLSSLEDEIFMKNNVRFRVIGDVKRLPDAVQQKLRETEEHTAKNDAMTMVVALSYSSRWEITEAVRQIIQDLLDQREDITRTLEFWKTGGIRAEDITEETISHQLHARPRPADSYRRRAAHLQLPVVADSLFRAVLLRHLLARLRRGCPAQGYRELPEAPAPIRKN